MAIFTLTLSDNTDTVDFMDSTYYKVMDGGFDIGTPTNKRTLAPTREGFYLPVNVPLEYREASIRFSIHGSSRTNCISYLHKITRIINNIYRREIPNQGAKGQLSYAWTGASNITYFEVFGADWVVQPADILSVDKIHRNIGGDYVIPDLQIKLYLSAKGYGLSIFSEVTNELAISTAYESAKTGGVSVENAGNSSGNSNWIGIASTQVPGSDPYIIKLKMTSGSTYSWWRAIYIGHQLTPFPTTTVFDVRDGTKAYGTYETVSGANPNIAQTYTDVLRFTVPTTGLGSSTLAVSWTLPNQIGTFMPIAHLSLVGSDRASYRFGLEGSDGYWGLMWYNEWITVAQKKAVPLGSVVLPPGNPDIFDYGNPDTLDMGIAFDGREGETQVLQELDYMQLLPITNGVRMIVSRAGNTYTQTGVIVDDYWKGVSYYLRSGTYVSNLTSLMSPIFLQPAINQRLYFCSLGDNQYQDVERGREFTVQLYAVPTYESLAE